MNKIYQTITLYIAISAMLVYAVIKGVMEIVE